MKILKSTFPFVLALMVASTGCASQATPDYEGDALTSVRGNVVGTSTTGSLEAAVAWSKNGIGGEFTGVGSSVAVTGSFPQKFVLDVLVPPPQAAIADPAGEGRIATGWIVAVPTGSSASGAIPRSALLGAAPAHFLLYNETAFAPGSKLANAFGGPLAAGYHLMTARPYTAQEKADASACKTNAKASGSDPDKSCPVFKLKVEPAGDGEEVELRLGPGADDVLPDLT